MAYSELRESLQALSDQSMKTTRQLDDVYYSILEKLSVLQSTISNLQDLSSMTKNLHTEFQSQTGTFEAEMREQIDAFGGFDNPKQRIGDLETRVKTSKEKADESSARLESARARVLALEAEEKEYQDMVSRTLLAVQFHEANTDQRHRSIQNYVDYTRLNRRFHYRSIYFPSPEATVYTTWPEVEPSEATVNTWEDIICD